MVGPVPGNGGSASDEALTIDDFNIDESTEQVVCCPAGYASVSSQHDTQSGKTHTVMPETACGSCEYFDQCPVGKKRAGYQLDHTAKQRRTATRRREESTEVFQDRYRLRGGIEGTNSGLKRRTGLGQLRVRGAPRVYHSIYLKVAGWNVLRSSVCAKMREIVYQRANVAVLRAYCFSLYHMFGRKTSSHSPLLRFAPLCRGHTRLFRIHAVA